VVLVRGKRNTLTGGLARLLRRRAAKWARSSAWKRQRPRGPLGDSSSYASAGAERDAAI